MLSESSDPPAPDKGAVNVLLWAMIAYETFYLYDERRYRLRHGLPTDTPGGSSAEGGLGLHER